MEVELPDLPALVLLGRKEDQRGRCNPCFPMGGLPTEASYPGVGNQEVSDSIALTFFLLLQLHCDVSIRHQSIRGRTGHALFPGGQMGEVRGSEYHVW